jgi:hypothetical protein
MSAWIIPFPAERVHRDPELINVLEKLQMCDEYEVSGSLAKQAMLESMRPYWEGRLAELGGVPKRLLQADLPDRENA